MKPLTRKEMLLDGAAKGNLDTFKPATREEAFAKRALANVGGSGGGVVFVNITGNPTDGYVADMTGSEVDNLIRNGVQVACIADNWTGDGYSDILYLNYINKETEVWGYYFATLNPRGGVKVYFASDAAEPDVAAMVPLVEGDRLTVATGSIQDFLDGKIK